MAVITRFGVYSISGSDLTFADEDMISGLQFVHIGKDLVAAFGVSPT